MYKLCFKEALDGTPILKFLTFSTFEGTLQSSALKGLRKAILRSAKIHGSALLRWISPVDLNVAASIVGGEAEQLVTWFSASANETEPLNSPPVPVLSGWLQSRVGEIYLFVRVGW